LQQPLSFAERLRLYVIPSITPPASPGVLSFPFVARRSFRLNIITLHPPLDMSSIPTFVHFYQDNLARAIVPRTSTTTGTTRSAEHGS
jgi:hypothetical protein